MSTATIDKPRETADALVDFRDVGMTYDDGTVALEHVDITVRRGEFVTVVGPSGCGKSTLLRIAAGLESHTAGDCNTHTDRVGFVFQDATLLPWRNVRKNVELLAELNGQTPAQRAAAGQEAIDLVGLAGFEGSMPRQLSGGMRMRASLARSLTLNPDLFLFDEPFGALDEITRQRLNDELLRLFAQRGFGGLFITHSVAEAVYLSTRVVVMSGRPGRIVDVVDVPFDMPRDPEIRFSSEFGALVGRVSHALKEAHA
ncbi:ABC transporter ATP-binding protein [Microbacterium sp. ZXX196]|uniref:ABC transporter ATP-binding protein n=1 Tax=Microbacterium sp. ZXX196 TaxID=2609291 RepID=UPI0012B9B73E|nr:ABC transporter ATP-binding protein [Microbacterium sp. ZXX196]MTE23387.1 ATP-binding cassette domain-containing protein [Microbacterium sp. ZXX196]